MCGVNREQRVGEEGGWRWEGSSPVDRVVLPPAALLDANATPLLLAEEAGLGKVLGELLRQNYMPVGRMRGKEGGRREGARERRRERRRGLWQSRRRGMNTRFALRGYLYSKASSVYLLEERAAAGFVRARKDGWPGEWGW